ncbi:DUF4145 domain-containing protein [Klebsiella pneumoniae]|uniref:DUF4145 domain-containing protein n=1 Tax=Klebsiella pneumoniae complex TaxID=3390273 RepID=UPI00103546D5|nr:MULTISPECIES: DUF4145 domain-containing protein [Klebsiella]MCQ8496855.1 DUF4145 domain-containing protein [Klebsiella pneumoniae]MDE4631074.1 DUF4145 domain-containing protein [Klebsiella pneumoniae]VAU30798.1 Uncharacterised protein [Klebsiella variicola]HBQ6667470.1 DUF4145 domain-containing protein [Klebsiella pneumoniae]
MNPSLLKTFTEHACPEWVCPLCHSKSLAILKGSFHSAAIPQSVARWQRIDGELDDIELVFSCLLKCDLGRCGTIVAASGSGFVTDTPFEAQENGEPPYTELFQVRSFTPPLNAFIIPAQCPDDVIEPLRQSFALYLSAPGAAANAIRIALEKLMTALGVTHTGSLYQRIEALPSEYHDYREALTAMRLLGNAGSHTLDKVTTTDVEQAYTIIEFVLKKIYEGSTEQVRQLVARLNDNFRPAPGTA